MVKKSKTITKLSTKTAIIVATVILGAGGLAYAATTPKSKIANYKAQIKQGEADVGAGVCNMNAGMLVKAALPTSNIGKKVKKQEDERAKLNNQINSNIEKVRELKKKTQTSAIKKQINNLEQKTIPGLKKKRSQIDGNISSLNKKAISTCQIMKKNKDSLDTLEKQVAKDPKTSTTYPMNRKSSSSLTLKNIDKNPLGCVNVKDALKTRYYAIQGIKLYIGQSSKYADVFYKSVKNETVYDRWTISVKGTNATIKIGAKGVASKDVDNSCNITSQSTVSNGANSTNNNAPSVTANTVLSSIAENLKVCLTSDQKGCSNGKNDGNPFNVSLKNSKSNISCTQIKSKFGSKKDAKGVSVAVDCGKSTADGKTQTFKAGKNYSCDAVRSNENPKVLSYRCRAV